MNFLILIFNFAIFVECKINKKNENNSTFRTNIK